MRDQKICQLFRLNGRFLRSIHLERDFTDAEALRGYVLTDHSRKCLERIAIGLRQNSGHRAWRITGDYGAGKSSFALLLAHWLAGDKRALPQAAKAAFSYRKLASSTPHLIPILVTGSREPIGPAIFRALARSLDPVYTNGRRPFVSDIRKRAESAELTSDEEIIDALLRICKQITADGKGTGLLLILDELGKFLEFATLHPEQQDIYFLQRLAEVASRSADKPIFVLGLLHQGFQAYAQDLSQFAQREWEKVAARFEEIIFDQPLEQLSTLIAVALNIRSDLISASISDKSTRAMQQAIKLGWFGAAPAGSLLLENAPRIYPLHPTVLPVLARVFNRFGQNERSLFSFLFSNEPFGLLAFADQSLVPHNSYRLHDLCDYVRLNFGYRLAQQSYRSHWSQIDSMIDSYVTNDPLELKVLKTVGVLNLVDSSDLLPTRDAILLSVATSRKGCSIRDVDAILKRLQAKKGILYHRGAAGGYCLWPYTSVDLERAYEKASEAVSTSPRVADKVADYVQPQPVVARRHYIKTGNLRYFDVLYTPVVSIPKALTQVNGNADGLFIIPLCETVDERRKALEFAKAAGANRHAEVILGIPPPLASLAGLVSEVQRWEWVSRNIPELKGDRFAAEEVSRQTRAARIALQKRLGTFIGLHQFTEKTSLECYHLGERLEVGSGRDLLRHVSCICDNFYPDAPRIKNELVNRRFLSSAAAAARMRLIERMLTSPTAERLGMDTRKRPPEMSMYLSVLATTKLHQEMKDGWRIALPNPDVDECNVLPAMNCISEMLMKEMDARIPVSEMFAILRHSPYGVRDGLIPILVAAFVVAHQDQVALYEKGSFLPIVEGEEFLRLTKAPETFEIQYCEVKGIRSGLLHKLRAIIGLQDSHRDRLAVLEVVRPICVFVANLPEYVRHTRKLSPEALAIREVVLAARDPIQLLFHDLPVACGATPFEEISRSASEETEGFVESLKSGFGELKMAYPQLKERINAQLTTALDLPKDVKLSRSDLGRRAEQILLGATEPKLKAFCLRLLDENLPETEWVESLASYLASRPPAKWRDLDEETFMHELSLLAARFLRVESLSFQPGVTEAGMKGIRLTLTGSDGNEFDRVVYVSEAEEKQLEVLRTEVESFLAKNKRLGLAAVSRAIWNTALKED